MKNIGILTQPLIANYGGILQNYALQKILRNMGYNPITFDTRRKIPLFIFVLSTIKTILLFFIPGKRRPFFKRLEKRKEVFDDFVNKYITKTEPFHNCHPELITNYNLDAIIVGSDQVWRPQCNQKLDDSFLQFASDSRIRKIAYAASFGVDYWEYNYKSTKKYAELLKKFDFVSVRENSGITLCQKYLNTDAQENLDPTLLLDERDYLDLCASVKKNNSKFLAAYILDMTNEKKDILKHLSEEKQLAIRYFSAEAESKLTIQEWLAMFRDASYIVTDSFHGTIFSIIFKKDFQCLYNNNRGNARFESIMNLHKSGKIDEMREHSLNWLKKALRN